MSFYVDVHTHLTHDDFAADWQDVLFRAEQSGLGAIVVNGLEPKSNRQILQWSQSHPTIKAALGIYPLEAINDIAPEELQRHVSNFNVMDEVNFIREQAKAGNVAAIGECGLDAYYLGNEYLPPQERIFIELIGIAMDYDLPLIIHTRNAEQRAGEILAAHGAKKVNFHCFGGRTAMAQRYAEQNGWWFSIPANCTVNGAFQKMLKNLPETKILTETDAPYLSPIRGTRNESSNVVGTVKMLAEYRGWTLDHAKKQVWENYFTLFSKKL